MWSPSDDSDVFFWIGVFKTQGNVLSRKEIEKKQHTLHAEWSSRPLVEFNTIADSRAPIVTMFFE